ncbi:MAG: polysaccharide pyruvyl transferase family protein [Verrucomicrobiales bacterium]
MIHHVYANRSNIGDWLSAKAIQALLAPEPMTEHLCDEPFVAETIDRLSRATARDLIVIGGGGLFMDYFAPFWQGFRDIAQRIPFCIWGVGYCDMKREDSRPPLQLLEEIARLSQLCVVRDELTRGHLRTNAFSTAVACPAISIVPTHPPGCGVLHVDALDNVGQENFERMEETGRKVAAETGRSFHSINNLIPAGSEKALSTLLGRYQAADLVLAGRLHGCIIGLAMGRKTLAVSGDHKIESFMRAAGLGDWVLDLHEIDLLPTRLRELPSQPAAEEFIAKTRREHREIATHLKRLANQLPTRSRHRG